MTREIRIALITPVLLLALAVIFPQAALEAQEGRSPRYESSRINPVTADLEGGAHRAAGQYDAPKKYTGKKISLEFKNEEIRNILKMISEASGKKIVVPETVSGKMTLKLRDVPCDQALDIVLAARNLGVEESDGVLTVFNPPTSPSIRLTRTHYAKTSDHKEPRLPPLAKKVFTPKYALIGQVAAELNKLKSERGKIVAIGNDIYVEDEPEAIATMNQIFMRLDRVTPQVLIEARIVEADAAFMESLGAKWKGGDAEPAQPMKEAGAAGEVAAKANPAALAYDFISKDKAQLLNTTLLANEGSGGARTISAPRIRIPNDQEVQIKQGSQIPYKSESSSSTISCPQFKEVVMELLARPHIEEDGQTLTLDLKIVAEATNTSLPEAYADIREAATKLQLKDGQTIVIGGIITGGDKGLEGRQASGRSGSISDWLFKDHAAKNIEMLIFLTASIKPDNI